MMIAAEYSAEPYLTDAVGLPPMRERMILERRTGSRVKIARPIRVVELSTGRHIAGRSRDVSSTGMKIEIHASDHVREGDIVRVDVGTLSGIGPLLTRPRVIPARVIWIRRENKLLRPLITAGVEFEIEREALVSVA